MNTESTKETEVSLVSCSKKKGKQMYLIYLNHSEYVSRQPSDKSDTSVSI